ncbi:MAG: gamma-glutamyltransferase [Candidatus Bathyarchaeia archaeon]
MLAESASGLKGVSTDSYLASKAALEIMEDGGNAFDAAVAASAVLSIVLPHTSGLGGDGFLLAFIGDEIVAYASCGKSPSGLNVDEYLRIKPVRGPLTVTVPGLANLWDFINDEFCKLPLSRVLKPAISLAYNGFYASRYLAEASKATENELGIFKWAKYFKGVGEGAPLKNKEAGQTLKTLASKGCAEFYHGKIAERFVGELKEQGVEIGLDDMASHRGLRVKPLKLNVDGRTLYESPPNTQGVTTLQAISAIHELDLAKYSFENCERIKAWSEIIKTIYAFRDLFIGDPDYMEIDVNKHLTYGKAKEALLKKRFETQSLSSADTTFFSVSDGEAILGFIQSLFLPFGSGLISLGFPVQSRGYGFAKNAHLPNSPAPRKRPLTTLSILGVKASEKVHLIGCAGGDWRPQIHARIYENLFVYGMSLEEALKAPRFIYNESNNLLVESGMPKPCHPTLTVKHFDKIGLAHVAVKDSKKKLTYFAADPRSEGKALDL